MLVLTASRREYCVRMWTAIVLKASRRSTISSFHTLDNHGHLGQFHLLGFSLQRDSLISFHFIIGFMVQIHTFQFPQKKQDLLLQ